MNIFDILGYRSDKQYSDLSKTSVGEYALVAPVVTSQVYFGSTNVPDIYYGSVPVEIYYGAIKVFG